MSTTVKVKYLLDVNVLSYLAALAHKHGARLASFDTGIKHAAVEVIKH